MDKSEKEKIKSFFRELKNLNVYEKFKNNSAELNCTTIVDCCYYSNSSQTLLDRTISWSRTPEGFDFWYNIYNELCPADF